MPDLSRGSDSRDYNLLARQSCRYMADVAHEHSLARVLAGITRAFGRCRCGRWARLYDGYCFCCWQARRRKRRKKEKAE